MLKELQVKNFALIDDITVSFGRGLNILSGETGAGKTLIIEAINMLLGERADNDLIRESEEKLIVQGYFDLNNSDKSIKFLKESGFIADEDSCEDIVITREVSRQGRNRAFINGIFTQVSALKNLGECFLDLHGQHDHQYLLEPETHLGIIDNFGKIEISESKREYEIAYIGLVEAKKEITNLKKLQSDRDLRLEDLRFKVNEIEKLDLRPDEEAVLENERNVLKNYERIYNLCINTIDILNSQKDETIPLIDSIAAINKNIDELSKIDRNYEKYASELDSLSVILSELNKFIMDYTDNLQYSTEKLDSIQERLFAISEIKRKYNMEIDQIRTYMEKLKVEISNFESLEDEIEKKLKQYDLLKKDLTEKALMLSEKRKIAIKLIERLVIDELLELNFKSASFQVKSSWLPETTGGSIILEINGMHVKAMPNGIDDIEFLISLNEGESVKPLSKVASGGEISRIMLALKTIVSGIDNIISMVFDEIDSGIGGNTAIIVGKKLYNISVKCQVICITHLPQIAAFADNHYFIDKVFEKGRTKITIQSLDSETKIKELSRMLSGMAESEISLKHAVELIEETNKIKKTY